MKRIEETLDRLDTYLRFMARQQQLKRQVIERTDYKCKYCGSVETEWAVMVHHLLEQHDDEIDWDDLDERLDELLED